ncbi:HNH endonuclease signature motif containing protein [Blastococcus sp. URHD0036]|uniref:HNH endonuclease signature motif containing protein n=1 Tax=Blastococcus sp. URHD0036 TaxID=1380356 RepID=UPI0018CC316A|nr:HNH endonuclease signature motif containing protein [Blastococcus sp. URHD0036]
MRRASGHWVIEAVHGRGSLGALADSTSGEPATQPPVDDAARGADGAPLSGPLDERARLLDEGAGLLDAAVDLERGLAQLAGARARALASFARCRPSAWDRQPGERGAASAASRAARPEALTTVSEWAVAEVAARLRIPGRTASGLLADCVELVEQLPATLASLEAGDISWLHARALVDLLRPVADEKKALVEARVLPRAPRQTVSQLRECTKRAVAKIDAASAVRRLVQAVRDRKVTLAPGQDGMAVLTLVTPGPVGRACYEALVGYADACMTDEEGRPDPRTRDQRMVDCAADLLLRPDAEGRSPVQVLLTVIATAGALTRTGPDAEEPGEIDGDTVPAALVRELVYAFGLMPRPGAAPAAGADGVSAGAAAADPADVAPPAGGPADRPGPPPTEGSDPDRTGETAPGAEDRPQAALAALVDTRRIADTALAERPRIAVVDELTGCLLALTDSIELRRAARDGHGLGPPPETDGYRPSVPLDRFVRLRDRRCRFPGCRARIRTCDLDHRVPHPHGPTAHTNLEGLCEHHHRLSHQAPGWRLDGTSDGGLVWTLPGGTTITTVPPRFGTDDGSAADTGATGRRTTERGAARAIDDRVDWRHLTPDERRARSRALVLGRRPRPDDEAAPF